MTSNCSVCVCVCVCVCVGGEECLTIKGHFNFEVGHKVAANVYFVYTSNHITMLHHVATENTHTSIKLATMKKYLVVVLPSGLQTPIPTVFYVSLSASLDASWIQAAGQWWACHLQQVNANKPGRDHQGVCFVACSAFKTFLQQ